MQRHFAQGFTFIEMLMALAIAAIVASIAYPSYGRYVARSHRTQAQAQLLQAAQWMERAATAIGTYPSRPAQADALDALQTQLSTDRYTLSITSADGSSFTITAMPQAAQSKDPCGTLTLDHTGKRSSTSSSMSSDACWGQ